MEIPFKKDPVEFEQGLLFPPNIFDLLPNDHECFVYGSLFELLDTSKVEETYSVLGQNAYHPRLVVGILIYAYTQGVFSSRQIEKKCGEDLGFMYIARLHCPNFRVLSDFRKDHYEFFKECFMRTVMLAKEAGMVSLGHVSLDGAKFAADTSKHKAMSYGRLKAVEKELAGEIESLLAKAQKCDEEEDEEYHDKTGYEIPEELKVKEKRQARIKAAKEALEKRERELHPSRKIEDKKQISFADMEARGMGRSNNFHYAYNGQISVDEDNQIIVGQHLSLNANDKQEVSAGLEEIRETIGELPSRMSLDNGYMSGANLSEMAGTEIDAYIATGREDKKDRRPLEDCDRKLKKPDFTYDADKDIFVCPASHTLRCKSVSEDGKKVYRAPREACADCGYRNRCCKSKKGEPRTITTDKYEPLRQEMIEKMERQSSKDVYKKRKVIVEPVFGQIKNRGFRRFALRGFEKTSGEFSLVCAVHNFKKIVTAVQRGDVCLNDLKLAITTT
ncbi:MAG: IS1182 family transposase [FCB group bacterium]|nr:IS1182 family transposase [FCB group bacterium]